jgi:tetratricopeptide (TPR) repeat protein
MKVLILIAAAVLVLSLVTWFFVFKPSPPAETSAQPQSTPTPDSSAAFYAEVKDLLFADQLLQEVLKRMEKRPSEGEANNPFSLWASSLAASQKGQLEEAKKYLKQALAIPDTESRVRLWTWKALRDLGERPAPKVAAEVQGVICELHNEAGVGTIAAYSDGRARWIGGQGAMTVWELPGTDLELNDRIRELLKSAEPLIRTVPATEKHKTPEPTLDHFRVSILTYGGIHTVEVFGPEIYEGHRMAPTLLASVKLLNTLQQKADEAEKQQGKEKPR